MPRCLSSELPIAFVIRWLAASMLVGDLRETQCFPYGIGENASDRVRQHRRPHFPHATEHTASLLLFLDRHVEFVELLLRASENEEEVDLVQVAKRELPND